MANDTFNNCCCDGGSAAHSRPAVTQARFEVPQAPSAPNPAVVQAAAPVAGAALLGTLGDVTKIATSAVNSAAELGNHAESIGITAESLQSLRYAFQQGGASAEETDKALQNLLIGYGEALQGDGALLDVLQENGIDVLQNGQARSLESLVSDLANVIEDTTSAAERARIASETFGDEGIALINTLRGGSDELDRLTTDAPVITEDLVNQAEETAAAWHRAFDPIAVEIDSIAIGLSDSLTMAITTGVESLKEELAGLFDDFDLLNNDEIFNRIDQLQIQIQRMEFLLETIEGKDIYSGVPTRFELLLKESLQEQLNKLRELLDTYDRRRRSNDANEGTPTTGSFSSPVGPASASAFGSSAFSGTPSCCGGFSLEPFPPSSKGVFDPGQDPLGSGRTGITLPDDMMSSESFLADTMEQINGLLLDRAARLLGVAAAQEQANAAAAEGGDMYSRLYEFTEASAQAITGGLQSVVQGTKSWGGALKSVARNVANLALQLFVLKPLEDALSNLFGGFNLGSIFNFGGTGASPTPSPGTGSAGSSNLLSGIGQLASFSPLPSLGARTASMPAMAAYPSLPGLSADFGLGPPVIVNIATEPGLQATPSEVTGPDGEKVIRVEVKRALAALGRTTELRRLTSDGGRFK